MEALMRRASMVAVIAAVLGWSPAFAQVSGAGSPTPGMGATSPLGMQAGLPVAPTGIPMGATELATPGISPGMSPSASGLAAGNTRCSGVVSSPSSTVTSLFDGGGITETASAACAGAATATSVPAISPSRAGATGIPLGSTELINAGLSPLLTVPTLTISPTASSPSPISASPTLSLPTGAATPCATTGASTQRSPQPP